MPRSTDSGTEAESRTVANVGGWDEAGFPSQPSASAGDRWPSESPRQPHGAAGPPPFSERGCWSLGLGQGSMELVGPNPEQAVA